MNTVYGKTFCLLACTTLFTGCLTTPACDVEKTEVKEEVKQIPAPAQEQQPAAESIKAPEPANTATGATVHHGVAALGNETQFATAIAHGNVIVDFYSPGCPPCRALAPELDALAVEYGTKVQFIKVDGSVFRKLSEQQKIEYYPTLFFYKDGKLVHKKVGGMTRNDLKQLINSTFGL